MTDFEIIANAFEKIGYLIASEETQTTLSLVIPDGKKDNEVQIYFNKTTGKLIN